MARILTFLFSCTLASLISAQDAPVGSPAETVAEKAPKSSSLYEKFQNPPTGYGLIPRWSWSSEALEVNRLTWQLKKLKENGIRGVQVDLSQTSASSTPAPFSDEWMALFSKVSKEAQKLGIGLSVDPAGAEDILLRKFTETPSLNTLEIRHQEPIQVKPGAIAEFEIPENFITARAHVKEGDLLFPSDVDLRQYINDGKVIIQAPEDGLPWEIWVYYYEPVEGTYNALLEDSGKRLIEDYYAPLTGNYKKGNGLLLSPALPLETGTERLSWSPELPTLFNEKFSYDIFRLLPALWDAKMPTNNTKLKVDLATVQQELLEERYHLPILEWHKKKGILLGKNLPAPKKAAETKEEKKTSKKETPPLTEDSFYDLKWANAPGYSSTAETLTPSTTILNSFSSLYGHARIPFTGDVKESAVDLLTTEELRALNDQFLNGANLLNHLRFNDELQESTASFIDFRMPYWKHLKEYFTYIDRLSFLMTQGDTGSEVAVLYPQTGVRIGVGAEESIKACKELSSALSEAGIPFTFIDPETFSQLKVNGEFLQSPDGRLSYRHLILPSLSVTRWKELEKMQSFKDAGGSLLSIGTVPSTTEFYTGDDKELTDLIQLLFPAETRTKDIPAVLNILKETLKPSVKGLTGTVNARHRKVGSSHIFFLTGTAPSETLEFRVKGKVELWDPWTGETRPLKVTNETEETMKVVLPRAEKDALVIVINSAETHVNPKDSNAGTRHIMTLPIKDWSVTLRPSIDNKWEDFYPEGSQKNAQNSVRKSAFRWAMETDELKKTAHLPETFDSGWTTVDAGYGPQMIQSGKHVSFSWKDGLKGADPAGSLPGHFLRFGAFIEDDKGEFIPDKAKPNPKYFILTANLYVDEETLVRIHAAEKNKPESQSPVEQKEATAEADPTKATPPTIPVTRPSELYVNGKFIKEKEYAEPLALKAGLNKVKVVYSKPGQAYLVFRKDDGSTPDPDNWENDPALIKYSPFTYKEEKTETPETEKKEEKKEEAPKKKLHVPAEWFRVAALPGTTKVTIPKHLSTTPPELWFNGEKMKKEGGGVYSTKVASGDENVIAIRLTPPKGVHQGALIPEPILIQSKGNETLELGDWSLNPLMRDYSGGVSYKRKFLLDSFDLEKITTIQIERVAKTAEMKVNGKRVGTRVSPPWKFSVKDALKEGENEIEITVYNTLSNHFGTGDTTSGLFGPISLIQEGP